MRALAGFARLIDGLNDLIGRAASWLTFGTVIVCALTALLRYVFSIGFVWMQELYVVLFAVVFMTSAGFTYLRDQHVRVDIYHSRISPRRRAWVELFGIAVFLLPWLGIVAYTGLPYIEASWRLYEHSPQPQGLPGYFLVKSLILVFCGLLALQGLSAAARSVLTLAGREDLLPQRPPEPLPAPMPAQ